MTCFEARVLSEQNNVEVYSVLLQKKLYLLIYRTHQYSDYCTRIDWNRFLYRTNKTDEKRQQCGGRTGLTQPVFVVMQMFVVRHTQASHVDR